MCSLVYISDELGGHRREDSLSVYSFITCALTPKKSMSATDGNGRLQEILYEGKMPAEVYMQDAEKQLIPREARQSAGWIAERESR